MGVPRSKSGRGVLQVERCDMNGVLESDLGHYSRLDILYHGLLTAVRRRSLLRKLIWNQLGMWRVKPVLLFNQLFVRRLSKVSVAEAKARVLRDLPAQVSLPQGVVLLSARDLLLVHQGEQLGVLALHNLSHCLVHEAGGFVQLGAILCHFPLALPGVAQRAGPISLLDTTLGHEAPGGLLWGRHLDLVGVRGLILVSWALALLLYDEVVGHLV
jgi:hypothetical protein